MIFFMRKTHAEATHTIMNQLQKKKNDTRFNGVQSPTATYIHTGNY